MIQHRDGLRFYHTKGSLCVCACGASCWGEPSLVVMLPHTTSGRLVLALHEECIPEFRTVLDGVLAEETAKA